MASQEHLDILRQGVRIWNRWRKEHPEVQPNLDNANLSSANLGLANLRGACHLSDNLARFSHIKCPRLAWEARRDDFWEKFLSHKMALQS